MMNCFETYLMLSIYILQPNHADLKKQFENLLFGIMPTRGNVRLIARTVVSSNFFFFFVPVNFMSHDISFFILLSSRNILMV